MKVTFEAQGTIANIAPKGRFDFNTHRDFRAAYEEALASSTVRTIQLDLKEVDYLDSSALGMLLLLKDKATPAGRTITIVNSQGSVRQILEVANFGKLFSIS